MHVINTADVRSESNAGVETFAGKILMLSAMITPLPRLHTSVLVPPLVCMCVPLASDLPMMYYACYLRKLEVIIDNYYAGSFSALIQP
jgi:hypothetical protein